MARKKTTEHTINGVVFESLVNYRLTREVTKKYYEMFGL